MTTRAIHFEIPVDQPQRAVEFYRVALGWAAQQWGDQPYWTVADAPDSETGIAGALTPRTDLAQGVLIYLSVEDLDDTLDRVVAAGGTVASARQSVPGVGWMARFHDTEGNLIGIMQEDPKAGP